MGNSKGIVIKNENLYNRRSEVTIICMVMCSTTRESIVIIEIL